MRFKPMAAAALLLATGAADTATAQARQAGAGQPAEISIPNSRRLQFRSAVNGRDYVVSVAVPLVPPPEGGYPVLYLLDSYWMFGTAVDNARMNNPEVMVVGIGYPLEDPQFVARESAKLSSLPAEFLAARRPQRNAIFASRTHDLTLPATAETRKIGGRPEMAEVAARLSGGLDPFLEMIEKEVKPRVSRIAPVDTTREALFGHSLGGLAVLHALFTRPEGFDSFIAASPSIWGAPVLWQEQEAFGRRVEQGLAPPYILLTVGEKEDDRKGSTARMVDNMREMARRLRTIRSHGQPLAVQDVVFAGEDHGTVQQASVSRAIAFAFPRAGE